MSDLQWLYVGLLLLCGLCELLLGGIGLWQVLALKSRLLHNPDHFQSLYYQFFPSRRNLLLLYFQEFLSNLMFKFALLKHS